MSLITRLEIEKRPLERLLDEINPNWKAGPFYYWQRDRLDKALDPAVLIVGYKKFSHWFASESFKYDVYWSEKNFVVVKNLGSVESILTNVEPQTDNPEIYSKNSVCTRTTTVEGMI